MLNAILTGLLSFLQQIISLILSPIDALITNILPDLSVYIGSFNQVLTQYVGPVVGWVANMLPPITSNLVIAYVSFVILLGTAIITVHGITLIYSIIQKIKMW